jgi:hypothetical protein
MHNDNDDLICSEDNRARIVSVQYDVEEFQNISDMCTSNYITIYSLSDV